MPDHRLFLTEQSDIGLDEQNFERKIVNIFLPISFNMFWVLNRTVSLRRVYLSTPNICFG